MKKLKELLNKITFRDINDKIHLYGAMWLTIALTFFMYFPLAFCVTNLLGLIYRLLEWKVLPIYNHPFFKRHPWLVFLSGDNVLNPYKLLLNLLGSTVLIPILYLTFRNKPIQPK